MLQDRLTRGKKVTPDEREHILRDLYDLYHQSRSMLAGKQFTLQDARTLSASVTDVRILLTELGEIESRAPGGAQLTAAIRDLKDRYWELEGMVKEIRNGLDREVRLQA